MKEKYGRIVLVTVWQLTNYMCSQVEWFCQIWRIFILSLCSALRADLINTTSLTEIEHEERIKGMRFENFHSHPMCTKYSLFHIYKNVSIISFMFPSFWNSASIKYHQLGKLLKQLEGVAHYTEGFGLRHRVFMS